MTVEERRALALTASLRLHELVGGLGVRCGVDRAETQAFAEAVVRQTADRFAAWLAGTTRLRLIPGPATEETSDAPSASNDQGENMTQINTGQKFAVTCDTEDASGFDTQEQIEWSISDEAVATLTVSEDTRSCTVTSGAPGSAVLTATVGSLGLSATLAVDVVPAGTATIELVPGDPEAE